MAKRVPAWEQPFLVRRQAMPKAKPPKNAPGVTDLASAVGYANAHGNTTAGPYSAPTGDIGDAATPLPAPPTPATASKAPVTPPAPGSPAYQDSIYNGQISNLQTNLKNFGTSLTGAGTSLMTDYGIDGPAFDPYNFDPTKNSASNFSIADNVDVTNPFSRAALLKKSYQNAARGDTNSMAARGQLYSGAAQNAQTTDTSNYNQGNDSLLKGFADQYGGLYGKWLTAQGNEQTGEGTATSDAIARWIAAGSPGAAPANPANGPTTPAPGAVPGSVSPTHPAGQLPAGTTTPIGSGGGPQKTTTTRGSAKKPAPKGAVKVVPSKGGKK